MRKIKYAVIATAISAYALFYIIVFKDVSFSAGVLIGIAATVYTILSIMI
jgi:hypothetical protein